MPEESYQLQDPLKPERYAQIPLEIMLASARLRLGAIESAWLMYLLAAALGGPERAHALPTSQSDATKQLLKIADCSRQVARRDLLKLKQRRIAILYDDGTLGINLDVSSWRSTSEIKADRAPAPGALSPCLQLADARLPYAPGFQLNQTHVAERTRASRRAARDAEPESGGKKEPLGSIGSDDDPSDRAGERSLSVARENGKEPVGSQMEPVGSSRSAKKEPVSSQMEPVGSQLEPVGSSSAAKKEPVGSQMEPVGSQMEPVGSFFGGRGEETENERRTSTTIQPKDTSNTLRKIEPAEGGGGGGDSDPGEGARSAPPDQPEITELVINTELRAIAWRWYRRICGSGEAFVEQHLPRIASELGPEPVGMARAIFRLHIVGPHAAEADIKRFAGWWRTLTAPKRFAELLAEAGLDLPGGEQQARAEAERGMALLRDRARLLAEQAAEQRARIAASAEQDRALSRTSEAQRELARRRLRERLAWAHQRRTDFLALASKRYPTLTDELRTLLASDDRPALPESGSASYFGTIAALEHFWTATSLERKRAHDWPPPDLHPPATATERAESSPATSAETSAKAHENATPKHA